MTAVTIAMEAMQLADRLREELASQKTKKRFYKAKIKALLAAQQFKRLSWMEAQEKMIEDTYYMLVTKADERRFKNS